MLYQISVLDYVVTAIAIWLLLKIYLKNRSIKKSISLSLILLLLLCYTVSLIGNPTNAALKVYIKIVSAFLLFFIGAKSKKEPYYYLGYLRAGYEVAFMIDLIALLTGNGFIYWGHAHTFKGFYFFKTDLAVALIMLLILISIKRRHDLIDFGISILSIIMIFLSNTRMALLILGVLLIIEILKHHEKVTGKRLIINYKLVIEFLVAIIAGLYLLQALGKTSFFKENGFISFSFNSISDLFSDSNSQGRNQIWASVMSQYRSASIIKKMLGVSINSFVGNVFGNTFSSHSLYIGSLFSIGIIGSIIYMLFLISIIAESNRLIDRGLFYCVLSLIVMYLAFGLSVTVYEYTSYTWPLFFIFGLVNKEYITLRE